MPRHGLHGDCTDCLPYGEDLADQFTEPVFLGPQFLGFLVRTCLTIQQKPCPSGEIGPFTPLPMQTTEVVLGFFSQPNQMLSL